MAKLVAFFGSGENEHRKCDAFCWTLFIMQPFVLQRLFSRIYAVLMFLDKTLGMNFVYIYAYFLSLSNYLF